MIHHRIRLALLLLALEAAFAAPARAEEAPLPAEYLTHVRQGHEHLGNHNTFRAAAEFQMALRVHAGDLDAWEGLARTAWMAGDEDASLLTLLRALELAPGKADLHRMLGDVHARAARRLAAAHAYREALRLAGLGEPLESGYEERIHSWLGKVEQANPELAAQARAAAERPGPPHRVACRYFSHAPTDASMRREASVLQGETLDPEVLRAVVFDEHGFPLAVRRAWTVTPGLEVQRVGDPPVLRAADRSSTARLTVSVEDAEAPLTATIVVNVIGPVARIGVRPAKARIQAGERVHFLVSPQDEAGHRVWMPEMRWSLEPAEPRPAGTMRRVKTAQPPAHFFEPHRNILDVAEEPPPRPKSTFRVIASDPTGKVRGASLCEVIEGTAAGRERPGGIAWAGSFEEAIASARKQRMPLLVEFTAEW